MKIVTKAVEVPTVVGVCKILNDVVALPDNELEGMEFMANSVELAPVIVIPLIYSVFVPVLITLNDVIELLPKSVAFNVLVVLPTGTLLPLPFTDIETDGAVVVVKPFATLLGLTQLDVLPLRAKLVSVPVLIPVSSINEVKPVLAPDGIP